MTSAQRKFTRGVEQVKRLLAEAEAFEHRDAYRFRTEVESRVEKSTKYRCTATEQEPPSDEWALLAGEAIQNLRASLDHAVWASAKRPDRKTAFPIFSDRCEFQVLSKQTLRGVPEQVRATIERAQPYQRYAQWPARAPLKMLSVLSNRDKHRTLSTVASAVEFESVGVAGKVDLRWTKMATGTPLGSGETHVSTFIVVPLEDVDVVVDPQFTYEVRIEEFPLSILRGIVHDTFRVLVEIETGQPISPFAAYPL